MILRRPNPFEVIEAVHMKDMKATTHKTLPRDTKSGQMSEDSSDFGQRRQRVGHLHSSHGI